MPKVSDKELIKTALIARKNAWTPYSNFKVGAALLADNGQVFTGCNIENAAFSPTNCAERTAFFKAISEGVHNFEAIAIVGALANTKPLKPVFPCGVCRQVMAEFCAPTFRIITGIDETNFTINTLAEILPHAFGHKNFRA